MPELLHFDTLQAYCKGINISPPKWELFDVRRFEDNMATVHPAMPPFKHEFYAIALRLSGAGTVQTGAYRSQEQPEATVFFNSPYQVLQWQIAPNWQGYYVIFDEAFYQGLGLPKRLTEAFNFLLVDNTVPLQVPAQEVLPFLHAFEAIFDEHAQSQPYSQDIIRHHLHILLLKVARLFNRLVPKEQLSYAQRDADLQVVSRFKALIETSFYPNQQYGASSPHQVQYYAQQLHLHPNHLNAVVKRITQHAASELIQKHVLMLAKNKLQHTSKSVKEIAFELYYSYPNHFATFFKKQCGMSPGAFRQQD